MPPSKKVILIGVSEFSYFDLSDIKKRQADSIEAPRMNILALYLYTRKYLILYLRFQSRAMAGLY